MSVLFAKREQEKGYIRRLTSQEHRFWVTPGRYLGEKEEDEIAAIPGACKDPPKSVSQGLALRHRKEVENLRDCDERESDDE
ncbi:MAG: hypothetical protein M1816_003569 [Peltula sp. TS41687]|nr:MAG: hypothetical protein M1816_003569 [Peltula sp. TS41687]